jgi:hypothetical protein
MSIINASPLIAAGDDGYRIERSLRFNSPDSAYLNRTPASATNRRSWSWSAWVKRGKLGGTFTLFAAKMTKDDTTFFGIDSLDRLGFLDRPSNSTNAQLITRQVFRDPSAWYHIMVVVDTPNATAGDRLRFYINGVRTTQHDVATYPSQNYEIAYINNTVDHRIGVHQDNVLYYYDGYLTEINFIDGQALTPSSFGETNLVTGVWGPKRYAGTYGTNGFYLKFADNSNTTAATLGKDSSGNGNNWTPNNFSVTAGVGNDSFIDVPTPYADGGNGRGNYATINPLDVISGASARTLINGNLDCSLSNTWNGGATFAVSSGSWYCEATLTSNFDFYIGIDNGSGGVSTAYRKDGTRFNGSSFVSYGATYTTNDVIGMAFDVTNSTVTYYKNGASQGQVTGVSYASTVRPFFYGVNGTTFVANFGQRPFAYTPPSGFVALNTQNLPEPSIKKPSSYMDATLYTGNGSTQTISGLNFSPDLVWIKSRSAATNNDVFDSVRGATVGFATNSTQPESTFSGVTAFNSNGFSLGSNTSDNANAATYVAWCWDESATPGFDIVTYTGNGTNRTIAHSLGVAPKMMIVKRRDAVAQWNVYHASIGATGRLYLNGTDATNTATAPWNDTAPTSSVFTVGTATDTNASGSTLVAYLWSEVAGFSKFGSYTGNNSTDGPFVHCGFRPRYVLVKDTISAGYWGIFDAVRSSYNVGNQYLQAQSSSAEDSTYPQIDFLSNGFKLRANNATSAQNNLSGNTYIFAAFAESPFKYSLAR